MTVLGLLVGAAPIAVGYLFDALRGRQPLVDAEIAHVAGSRNQPKEAGTWP